MYKYHDFSQNNLVHIYIYIYIYMLFLIVYNPNQSNVKNIYCFQGSLITFSSILFSTSIKNFKMIDAWHGWKIRALYTN